MLVCKKTLPILLLMGVVLFLMGARFAAPQVIEAEAFRLKDKEGRVRASFELSDDGTPSLKLFDAGGRRQFGVFLQANGNPTLEMGYRHASTRLTMTTDAVGGTGLVVNDANGNRRLAIGVAEDPQARPFVMLFHDSHPRLVMGLDNRGMPEMSFRASDDTSRLLLVGSDDDPKIGFLDAKRRGRMSLGLNPDDQQPFIMMSGKQKEDVVFLDMKDSPILFSIFGQDKSGNIKLFLSPTDITAQFNGADKTRKLEGKVQVNGPNLLQIKRNGKEVFKSDEIKPSIPVEKQP